MWSSPASEAMGVALRQSVRVQFDRFLRPDTTSRQSICIQAGPNDACATAALEYDPVDRVVVAKPSADLLPNTRYNVRLLAPTSSSPEQGIRTFDDVPLAAEATFSFTTGAAGAMPTLAEPMRNVDFCAAMAAPNAVFKGCAALTSCHGPGEPPAPSPGLVVGNALTLSGPMGMDVPAAVRALLAGNGGQPSIAIETATAPDPNEVRRAGNGPFGQNMPYLDPNNPANSYVVYKLMIVHAQGAPCLFDKDEPALAGEPCGTQMMGGVEPWVPSGSGRAPILGEHDRLKARIRGDGMPGSLAALRSISAWIAAGAITPMIDCP